MKKLLNIALAALCTGAVALSLTGCNAGKSTELGKPVAATSFEYKEYSDTDYIDIKEKANNFAYNLSAAAYSEYGSAENFSVAPVSVFSALSLAAECSGGETRGEILSALGINYSDLSANYSKLYRSLEAEYKSSGGSLEGALKLSNSVWINEGLKYSQSCVRNLSENYFAYSYSADFAHDNANANKAVRSFVKDKTKGLIDKDFNLSPQTVFTLINALYIKDIWNTYGDDLGFTADKYTFTEYDGHTEQMKLLQGYYHLGKTRDYGDYSAFFTQTLNGYKIKFLVPKDGHSVKEIFTAGNLATVNGETGYGAVDDENKKIYHTRCLFPEFETSYDNDIADILKKHCNINRLFDESLCDFSAFIESNSAAGGNAYCGSVRHVNKLKVNKNGIEGAAVTVIPAAGSPGPGEYENVYEDFVVDRAFGFILTDRQNSVIFSGIVNEI